MISSFTIPESGEDERSFENRLLVGHSSGLFFSACSENDVTSQRMMARLQLQTVGSLEHKFVMADAKNLLFHAKYFHLEGAKVHFNDRNRYSYFW